MSAPLILHLPYPPTVNHLFVNNRRTGGRFPSSEYKAWQQHAGLVLNTQPYTTVYGPIEVRYVFGRPDKRARDVFNLEKAVSDLLVKMKIIEDDSLIQRGIVEWNSNIKDVKIFITPLANLL